jgi:hypothetical protein
MQMRSGKQHSSGHAKEGLGKLLDELGTRGPALVRGDCGYGNQDIIEVCEKRDRRYLLRLRKTTNVKRLLERLFNRQDWTQASEASQGWQAIEDHLRLSGWSKERRVVVLRRRIKRDVALTAKRGDKGQQLLALGFDEAQDDTQLWEYTVLVTDVAYDLNAIGQLYRDRCDCGGCPPHHRLRWRCSELCFHLQRRRPEHREGAAHRDRRRQEQGLREREPGVQRDAERICER